MCPFASFVSGNSIKLKFNNFTFPDLKIVAHDRDTKPFPKRAFAHRYADKLARFCFSEEFDHFCGDAFFRHWRWRQTLFNFIRKKFTQFVDYIKRMRSNFVSVEEVFCFSIDTDMESEHDGILGGPGEFNVALSDISDTFRENFNMRSESREFAEFAFKRFHRSMCVGFDYDRDNRFF